MGNICRSPMAEAVFQHMVNAADLADKIHVDSAGTHAYHVGEQADPRTLEVLHKNSIPYQGRARRLNKADLEAFDYIVVMDAQNLNDAQRIVGHSPKVHLFLSYANAQGTTHERIVDDPYYNGDFDATYTLVTQGAQALLAHIRQTHQL
jgi:protein-tyrosine phosphatase